MQTHLAYIVTGDAEVDAVSKAGLQGLTLFLAQRTALEAGEPIGLDPARDELAFFPLIYWPISPSAPKPSQAALDRIDTYMKRGGTVLFDTRDAVDAPPGPGGEMQGPGMVALRSILSSLDIPELEPVPRDHVLTKTFFLLRDFPGRFTNGQLWVEALPAETEEDDQPPGARRRRRVLDPDHLERSRRRLGDAPGRPADAAAGAGRAAPARIRLPRRRQHRDVRAHRQLQGRPGAHPGAARTAGTVGAMNLGVSFAPLVPAYVVWAAFGVAVLISILLLLARSRGAPVRALAMALMVLALANPSLTREDRDPIPSVAAVIVDKSPSQNFGDRNAQTEAARATLVERLKRIPGLEVRVAEAGEADGETRRHAAVLGAVLDARRRAARPRRRRRPDHRRPRARRAGRRRRARALPRRCTR